jgi:hypothetical protein
MEKVTIRNYNDWQQAWGLALAAGLPCAISIGEQRTSEQNKKLWPMLADVAIQCRMMIDGQMQQASAEDWKSVFISALDGEQRVARGINGGLVFLRSSSRNLTKRQFSDLLEIIYAYGAEHGVCWSEPSLRVYETYREAA